MPVISAEPIEKNVYRLTVNTGYGNLENITVSSDGLYSVYYIKDGKCVNATGRILNVVQNRARPQNSYILFDYSEDVSNKKEHIQFFKIQMIKDITPNNAYIIALEHGFVGTVEEWLESLKGESGKSAYELAVEAGFEGTEDEWFKSLQGKSAYEIAVNNGFLGTEKEWLESLKGEDGKSAYDVAVDKGFEGTEEEWLASLQGVDGKSAYDVAVEAGFEGSVSDWLESLKGERGKDGKSAYEIAVENGYEGSEKEWLESVGDTTALRADFEEVKTKNLSWHPTM